MFSKNIVAIGGGGFGRSLGNLKIEKYIVSLVNKKVPKICFIPTASGDNDLYKLNFYRAFSKLNCETSHIDFFSRTEELEEKILSQDIVYVGGGNTKSMLAVWREWNLDKYLLKAYNKGTVLAGVSAGAICWFDQGITDSWASSLNVIDCLGLIPGTCCPHYDSEKDRKPSVHKFIKGGKIKFTYAIEDGAAMHFIENKPFKNISFFKDSKVYNVKEKNGQIVDEPLDMTNIF